MYRRRRKSSRIIGSKRGVLRYVGGSVTMVQMNGNVFYSLCRFFSWMVTVNLKKSLIIFGMLLIQGIFPGASVFIISKLFQEVILVFQGSHRFTEILIIITIWAVIILVDRLIQPFYSIYMEQLQQELEDSLTRQLQEKAHRLRLETFERADFHDILSRARNMTEPGEFFNLLIEIFDIIRSIITVSSVIILLSAWNVWLFVALIVVALPVPIAQWIQSKSTFFLKRQQTEKERVLNYLEKVMTSREAAKEVRMFGMSSSLLRWWHNMYWEVANSLYRQQRNQNIVRAGLSIIGIFGLAFGVAWAAWSVMQGDLLASQFGAILIALQVLKDGVNTIVGRFSYFRDMLFRVNDLFIYLDLGPEEQEGKEFVDAKENIYVEDVSFCYPQQQEDTLHDISFTIQAGERLAIVGDNGSGKTTLVKVLLGLYQPKKGSIRYGSVCLADADLTSLRAHTTAAFQDFNRYAFTLNDNIGYGKVEHMHLQEEVEYAAKLGGADQVAASLVNGYHTPLTREFADGTDLSGGQWQKIAISRAFMRNAPFVLLDEPSAALDPKAEAEVFERFLCMAKDKTAILVSHRLGMARLCDRILVLKDGRIAEIGTHDELLRLKGEYHNHWSLQAGWYI
ncbi:ABC transporter ATP-binding protein [Paenibacillaceae bacterium]|nr:ABC transporter ATP-binding protein [Paenibacillaceae bacterium]